MYRQMYVLLLTLMKNNKALKEIIKKHLFIIYTETFFNSKNNNFIERYVAKHPLLKPELIIVNDQIHGFKKISKKASSLEEFPIYLELEGILEKSNMLLIDSIELYSECQINCQDRLTDIIYFTKLFGDYITLERSIDILSPLDEIITIKSKIQEYLVDFSLDTIESELYSAISNEVNLKATIENDTKYITEELDDDEDNEGYITASSFLLNGDDSMVIDSQQFQVLLSTHLKYFVKFVQVCHDLLITNQSFNKIKKDVETFLYKK